MGSRLLILGSSGQVACDLPEAARLQGFSEAIAVGRGTADLVTTDALQLLERIRPDAVINAAAYTAVDKAETEREEAFALNADMPGRFAVASASMGIPFVHISTDYVFDGSKAEPYVESDPRAPLGVYGHSKSAGEDAVRAADGTSAIMRTAWVYGPHGSNFMKTMIRLAETRPELGVVGDQIGCPTPSRDVAEGAVRLAKAMTTGQITGTSLFHCAGAGEASWADFATAIFAEQSARGRPAAVVRAIPSSEYPTPARRPANSRLASDRLESAVGWRPQHWHNGLTDVFRAGSF